MTTIANNVVIANCRIFKNLALPSFSWIMSLCEYGVGDKAVPGEEHSESTIFIQQGQTICVDG